MNRLIIDTTKTDETTISLVIAEKKDSITEKRTKGSQMAVELIEKLLSKHFLKLDQIEEIAVETGPGSFTGLRVGVAIANALGFAKDIKINGQKNIVEPKYK